MIGLLRTLASKLVALAILFALVFGVLKIAIEPFAAQHADLEDGIETQRALLGRLQAAATAAKAATQPSGQAGRADTGPVFLEGESDAIRMANLQSKLGEAAQSFGVRLSSTQALEPREDRDVRLVGVQTQFSTTLVQLQKLVFDLETSRPMLFVQTMHVSRGPDRDGEAANELDVRLVVLGAVPRVKGQP